MPIITIFCAFTRRWAIEKWLEDLAHVRHDPALTNLCFIVDCDEPYIEYCLKKFAEDKGYRSFHLKSNPDNHPNEIRQVIRRARIAEVKNQSKDLIAKTDGHYIVCFEDDTVFERLENFERLVNPLIEQPDVGFVEGVQMGRWGARMVGVWEVDDPSNPTEAKTLIPPIDGGVQEISGGGFYGYATRRDLYLNHEYYTSTSLPYGPDLCFSLWVKQQGFKCLVDWSIMFGHSDHSQVKFADDADVRLVEVLFKKDKLTGHWDRTDTEKGRY